MKFIVDYIWKSENGKSGCRKVTIDRDEIKSIDQVTNFVLNDGYAHQVVNVEVVAPVEQMKNLDQWECMDNELMDFIVLWARTGSSWTCEPAPIGRDQDHIIFVYKSKIEEFRQCLLDSDFETCGDYEDIDFDQEKWFAVTHGKLNLIITHSDDFYNKYVNATNLCKELNLMQRDDRVKVFEYFRSKLI